MYTAHARIELITVPTYGGGPPGHIKMFELEIKFSPRLRDWIIWVNQGLLPVQLQDETILSITPDKVHQKDDTTFEFFSKMILPTSQDSIEYYQELISKGWKPNTEHAKAIQSFGYHHFRPDKF